ncbi:MCE family protein [Streptomyces sp. RB6PN25]|uniref:MCE family protein n=1 Tax=Streptomyces humicola TaxID=2953240 RepID=A0ABT1PNF2_9ACTN|nr:MCE family protein [Streptomyces humicola]MCQ4079206.1 MCE family protein [Streptomyces humicola]
MRRLLITTVAVLAMAGAAFGAWSALRPSYHASVLLASADNLTTGGWVTVNGFKAGKIDSITVQDGKALVGFTLDSRDAPLHDGAKVTVEWEALLGERWVEIQDGPKSDATIPSGGMIPGQQATPVNLDQVLNALDPPTRQRLASLVNQLNDAVRGHEGDTNATLLAAGPALSSLGQVLSSLGSDGPAMHDLVSQLNKMVGTLSARDQDIRGVIDDLSKTTSATVGQRQQLAAALQALPSTLDTAQNTLNDVPGAANKAVPLLNDLRPATNQLPTVAQHLEPVLTNLTPLVERLGPTLTAAQALLQYTPDLLDSANATLPGITNTTSYLQPALNYLRPYTPELAGWFSEWSGNGSRYDANGHFVRFYPQEGATTFSDNPGVVPPGSVYEPYPLPGQNVNQPWTDAWGGTAR